MAINKGLMTGRLCPLVDPNAPATDRRRRWPFSDLAVGDWFEFDPAAIASVRTCAHAYRKKPCHHGGVNFSIGMDPDPSRTSIAYCVRIPCPPYLSLT
jgi:hypothetical protein